jgi:hypothetical protein
MPCLQLTLPFAAGIILSTAFPQETMPVNVMLQTLAIAVANKLIGKLVTTSGYVL